MNELSLLILNENLNEDLSENQKFNNFVLKAYQSKRETRPSVSQLSDLLRKYGCEKPGTLACLYAVKLEEMAKKENNQHFWV